jgi:uncharacterized protein
MQTTSAPASPPASAARDSFADELRGFALLGIVFVNAPFLAISAEGYSAASIAAPWDRAAALLTVALAQAKFYLLFAFLFGYSLQYIVKDGTPQSVRRFKLRLVGLALIGALHAAFLFVGDILMLYAALGVGLLWLRTRPDAVVVRAGLVAALAWLALLGLLLVATVLWPPAASSPDPARLAAQAFDAALRDGSFWEAAAARVTFWPWAAALIATLNGLAVFSLFCLGLVAGRRRLLSEPAAYATLWQRGVRWGLGLGLPLGALGAWLVVGPGASPGTYGVRETSGIVLGFASAPVLTWGYVAWLARWRLRHANALALFRPAGRMSLTVYIAESLLLSLLFCGYGAGLFGQWGAAAVALCALLVWALLDAVAHLVQMRWRSGPLETVLRRFSGA